MTRREVDKSNSVANQLLNFCEIERIGATWHEDDPAGKSTGDSLDGSVVGEPAKRPVGFVDVYDATYSRLVGHIIRVAAGIPDDPMMVVEHLSDVDDVRVEVARSRAKRMKSSYCWTPVKDRHDKIF